MFLKSGFSTDGDIDKVLFVGPIEPTTYLCIPIRLFYLSTKLNVKKFYGHYQYYCLDVMWLEIILFRLFAHFYGF